MVISNGFSNGPEFYQPCQSLALWEPAEGETSHSAAQPCMHPFLSAPWQPEAQPPPALFKLFLYHLGCKIGNNSLFSQCYLKPCLINPHTWLKLQLPTSKQQPLSITWHKSTCCSSGMLFRVLRYAVRTKIPLWEGGDKQEIGMPFLFTGRSFTAQACAVWTMAGFGRLFTSGPFYKDHTFSGRFYKTSSLQISV